ncbi:MAG: GNAT family N-acetyltransferase [Deltaproteobacteria bacterium]|nr:MAG: GNAT family N-acetyltransferase [Deltaproteobacteria bacterium]
MGPAGRETAAETAVRFAGPGDLDVIVEGNRAMALETEDVVLDPDTVRAGVAAGLAGAVDARYLLATRGGRVAGQLMVTREWSDWRNGPVWWIQSVYVWPEFRRQGVYRALYAAVLDEARAAGAVGVRLYVDARNTAAQRTYAALGMDGDHYRVFEQMLVDLPVAGP